MDKNKNTDIQEVAPKKDDDLKELILQLTHAIFIMHKQMRIIRRYMFWHGGDEDGKKLEKLSRQIADMKPAVNPVIFCKNCRKETVYTYCFDTAYGMPETYMKGSERYECSECGKGIYSSGNIPGLIFVIEDD
ncbi:MAG: hypothetical protein V1661_03150 [bacterium]